MRTTLLLLTFFAFSFLCYSQSDDVMLVYSIEGRIFATSDESDKKVRIKPGSELTETQTLQLPEGGSIGMFWFGSFLVIDKAGEYLVGDVMDKGEFEETNTARLFASYLTQARHPFFQENRLTRSGFTGGETTSTTTTSTTTTSTSRDTKPPAAKEKEGHGNKEYPLVRLQPTGGKVTTLGSLFEWEVPDSLGKLSEFVFVLKKENEEVLRRNVSGTSLAIQPDIIKLEAGSEYTWQVMSTSDSDLKSAPVPFECVSVTDRSAWLNKLFADPMYLESSEIAQQLLRACHLEFGEYQADARTAYQVARKMGVRNQLVQDMYEAFVWRYGLVPAPAEE